MCVFGFGSGFGFIVVLVSVPDLVCVFSVSVPYFVLYWIWFRSRIRCRWIGWNGGQSSPGFGFIVALVSIPDLVCFALVSVPDFVLYWICFRSRIRFRWIGWNGGQSSLPGFLGYDFACQHAWMLKMSESVGSEPLEYTSGEKSSALPTRSRVYGLLEQWLFTRSLRAV